MSEGSDEPLLDVLFYSQLLLTVIAIAVWIAVTFGPLVKPWFFLIMAVAAGCGLLRAYIGRNMNEQAEQTVIQGEAGVFHALASAEQPMTAKALGNILPHTVNDVEYRLMRLERKGLIGTTEQHGATYYYVKSTNPESSSVRTENGVDEESVQAADEEETEVETE